ncbi:DNA primase [Desulfonatronospira sp.]|uniref:DNA primase n=1 Tax=Desulfonatronospira sp. TaxID=1962951 RepID=UPI0025C22CDA|nr:DNA primase [Desulfonatronospira sp.]
MSFIDPREVAEIKSRLSLEDIVGRYVQLKTVGGRLMGPCPFHQETRASFSVTPDQGFYYCFGCQASGDIIEFFKNINGLDFNEAVTQLAAEAGVKLTRQRSASGPVSRGRVSVCREVNSWSNSFFGQHLQGSEGGKARRYLEKRKISEETARAFALGWSPDGWNNLKSFLESKGFSPEDGVEAGVLSQNERGRIYDRFRSRLIFPIIALSGAVVAFGGRVVGDGEPKYLNSSESPLYTKGEHLYGLYQARTHIIRSSRVLLTEGYLDVMALHQYGFENSCGVLGTSLTRAQVKRMSGLAREVVLIFDGDGPGQNAALKSAEMILQAGLSCRVLILPEGEDAHSRLIARGRQGLEGLLQKTSEGLDFCLKMLSTNKSPGEIMKWVENFITYFKDLSWRSYYIPRVAHALGLTEKELREKFTPSVQKSPGDRKVWSQQGRGAEQRDRELLTFAVCFPEDRVRLQNKNMGLVLASQWARQFWEKLRLMQEDDLSSLSAHESAFFVQSKMQRPQLEKEKRQILAQIEEFIDRSMARISTKNLKTALSRAQQNQDHDEVRRILKLLQKSF